MIRGGHCEGATNFSNSWQCSEHWTFPLASDASACSLAVLVLPTTETCLFLLFKQKQMFLLAFFTTLWVTLRNNTYQVNILLRRTGPLPGGLPCEYLVLKNFPDETAYFNFIIHAFMPHSGFVFLWFEFFFFIVVDFVIHWKEGSGGEGGGRGDRDGEHM